MISESARKAIEERDSAREENRGLKEENMKLKEENAYLKKPIPKVSEEKKEVKKASQKSPAKAPKPMPPKPAFAVSGDYVAQARELIAIMEKNDSTRFGKLKERFENLLNGESINHYYLVNHSFIYYISGSLLRWLPIAG